MILLHLILSNYPSLPDTDLLEDVEKSLQIFSAMTDIIVARRCAEMLREVLEVARTCLRRRRCVPQHPQDQATPESRTCAQSGMENSPHASAQVRGSSSAKGVAAGLVPQSGSETPAPGLVLEAPSAVVGPHGEGEGDFFFSLFSNDAQMQTDRTRVEMLANLVDSSVLEDFAFGGENEFSFF